MFKSIISCVHNIYIKYIFVNQKGALQVKTHFYDLKFNDAQGEEQSMESYKGKVILIINTPVETENNEQLTDRSEEHTSELQSRGHLVCRLLLEKKKNKHKNITHKA